MFVSDYEIWDSSSTIGLGSVCIGLAPAGFLAFLGDADAFLSECYLTRDFEATCIERVEADLAPEISE